LSGLWGKLACNILLHQWEYGMEDFEKLKTFIDEDPFRNALQVHDTNKYDRMIGLWFYRKIYCKCCNVVFIDSSTTDMVASLGTVLVLQPYEGMGLFGGSFV
jgi:hypothetical protein